MVPVRPELDEAVGRHVRRRPRLPVRLEGAEDEAAAVVPDIQVAIEIAEERQSSVAAAGVLGHDPDMLGRVQGDARIGQPRQLGRPQAGGQDDDVRVDVAGGRRDAGDRRPSRARRKPVTVVSGT